MVKPLKLQLVESFPHLFKLYLDPNEQGYPLKYAIRCDFGWIPLLKSLFEELTAIDPGLTLRQVKSKFAILRVYYTTSSAVYDQHVRAIVQKYESLSAVTCEKCGQPGESASSKTWIYTLCPTHKLEIL